MKQHNRLAGPTPGPTFPEGGARPRVTVAQPSGAASTRSAPIPVSAAKPAQGSRISDAVREKLKDLDPELAAHIREVADTK